MAPDLLRRGHLATERSRRPLQVKSRKLGEDFKSQPCQNSSWCPIKDLYKQPARAL